MVNHGLWQIIPRMCKDNQITAPDGIIGLYRKISCARRAHQELSGKAFFFRASIHREELRPLEIVQIERVCRTTRLRATAKAAYAEPVPGARCITSATAGTAGRRRFPRVAPMPTTWTSITVGSTRITPTAVRTVFSCVASRNRERTESERGTPTGQCLPQYTVSDSGLPGVCRVRRRRRKTRSLGEWCPPLRAASDTRLGESQLPDSATDLARWAGRTATPVSPYSALHHPPEAQRPAILRIAIGKILFLRNKPRPKGTRKLELAPKTFTGSDRFA